MNVTQLYNLYKNLVYNLALQYVQNREDAEEITQDVFVAIHQSLSKFREEANIKTWIYRITINKSLDFLKAKKAKKRFGIFTSLFEKSAIPNPNQYANFNHPGAVLENKEALENIFNFINQLPHNQKTVIILTKIEQKSQLETAQIMNISAKAVESLVQRAKVNLQKKINS